MADLYRQGGRLEEALEAIETAKSTCPTDRPDLLSSIFITKFVIHQEIYTVLYRNTVSAQELENAVAEVEGALQTQSDLPPPQRAILLTGVAQSIYALYEDQHDFAGRVRDAIAYAWESVGLNVGEQGPRIQATVALADALSSSHAMPTFGSWTRL